MHGVNDKLYVGGILLGLFWMSRGWWWAAGRYLFRLIISAIPVLYGRNNNLNIFLTPLKTKIIHKIKILCTFFENLTFYYLFLITKY